MPVIELATVIRAPRERVFDLARSIDAHRDSAVGTGELAVAGVTRGLIGMGDEVTWEARHFGIRQRLTVRITAFEPPSHFQDIMISGVFRSMAHDHAFEVHPEGTLMRDRFEFSSPLGILGRIAERLFLTSYMRRFLLRRNAVLKQLAESGDWGRYVQQPHHGSGPA
ncbi:MAG: SRPBCC family protein [Verrucomicrobia bacterium]|nr:SRPBCC family protein [Verrucomicrobiota bacterium]